MQKACRRLGEAEEDNLDQEAASLVEWSFSMPSNLQFADIKELRIVPRNGCFYAEFAYRQEAIKVDVDPMRVLGIDAGVNNWLTCVSNVGTRFIVDGL